VGESGYLTQPRGFCLYLRCGKKSRFRGQVVETEGRGSTEGQGGGPKGSLSTTRKGEKRNCEGSRWVFHAAIRGNGEERGKQGTSKKKTQRSRFDHSEFADCTKVVSKRGGNPKRKVIPEARKKKKKFGVLKKNGNMPAALYEPETRIRRKLIRGHAGGNQGEKRRSRRCGVGESLLKGRRGTIGGRGGKKGLGDEKEYLEMCMPASEPAMAGRLLSNFKA